MSSTEELPAGDEPATQDVSAESSAAEGVKESMLDAVTAAIKPTEAAPTSEGTGEDTHDAEPEKDGGGDGEGKSEQDEAELSEDERKLLSPRAQRRFRELATGKSEAERQVKELSPKAEQLDKIVTHLRTHGIAPQEFDNAIEITRLVKHDPDKAFEIVGQLFQSLAQRTGKSIPPELLDRVQNGEMAEDAARELSQARAREAERQRTESERREREERDNQERAWKERVDTVTAASEQWAKQKASSDPDWNLKQQDVADQVQLELSRGGPEGYPKDANEVVALAERALKKVEDRIRAYRPKPQEHRPNTGQAASPRAQPEPKTFLEAVQMAVAQ